MRRANFFLFRIYFEDIIRNLLGEQKGWIASRKKLFRAKEKSIAISKHLSKSGIRPANINVELMSECKKKKKAHTMW